MKELRTKLDGTRVELGCEMRCEAYLCFIGESINDFESFVQSVGETLRKPLLSELYQCLSAHSPRNLSISSLIISLGLFYRKPFI